MENVLHLRLRFCMAALFLFNFLFFNNFLTQFLVPRQFNVSYILWTIGPTKGHH